MTKIGFPDLQSISVFARGDDQDTLRVVLFESDGFVEVVEATLLRPEGEETVFEVDFPANDRRPGELRQTIQKSTPGTFAWKLWLRPLLENADWTLMMESEWHKQRIPMNIAPIDASLFDVTGTETNEFVLETTIEASTAAVFAAWTQPQVFRQAFDPSRPELSANIDLAIGGRYEWLFDGETGSNGCQVLSYIPDRMFSFTWNAPPDQPESRARRTWVVVELTEQEGATHVRLTHLGFGEGEHWAETRAYFQQAWTYVLGQFVQNLAG